MRHHYLRTFDQIYVDNLHGDRKISEYAPDGQTSETVFAVPGSSPGIRIGTAISTLVRKPGRRDRVGTVNYRDFEDARASDRRESLLQSLQMNRPAYSELSQNIRLGFPFKPRTVQNGYLDWPRLPELFPTCFPGIKTSRDSLVVNIDRERLETNMRQYLATDLNDVGMAELVPASMEASARFDPQHARRTLQERGFRPWQVMRYVYRPFDVRWMYWEPTTKLLDEKRSEYVAQVITPAPCLVAQQKSRGESSPPQFISQFGCLDLFDRGASCFPASVVHVAGTLLPAVQISKNLSLAAEEKVLETGGNEMDLFFHALATMHTPQYRLNNEGALLSDWPRIPLPTAADLLTHSAALGRRLAELLDAESAVQFGTEWTFLGALKLPRDSDLTESLKITADWGRRGQGSTVMPAPGRSLRRAWTDEERGKVMRLANARTITLADALTLLGDTCVDVCLNGDSMWSAVPVNVWNYTLGGYQVLKKWLSYREFDLLGRALRADEAAYFAEVVRRIAAILLMSRELDTSYQAILPTAVGLASA